MDFIQSLIQKLISALTAFFVTLSGFGGGIFDGGDDEAVPYIASGTITDDDLSLGESTVSDPEIVDLPLLTASGINAVTRKSITSFGTDGLTDKITDCVNGGGFFYACGSENLISSSTGFIVKYNTEGKQIKKTDVGSVSLSGITYTTGNGIVVCGSTGTTKSSIASKYDTDGNLIWTKNFYGESDCWFSRVAATADGGVVLCGKTYCVTHDFDGIPDYGYGCGVMLKLDKDGNREWMRYLGGSGVTDITDIDTDSYGNIFISCSSLATDGDMGAFSGLVDNSLDNVIIKYNSSGVMQWYYTISSNCRDYFEYVKADGSGGCYAGGYYTQSGISQIVQSGTLKGKMMLGGSDGYLVAVSQFGVKKWELTVGGSANDCVTDIVTAGGNIIMVGYTNSSGGTFSANSGEADAFAVIVSSAGKLLKTVRLGGTLNDYGSSCSLIGTNLMFFGQSLSQDGDFKDINTTASTEEIYGQVAEFTDCFAALYTIS